MYFKRLEMHGFKSFADPVVIDFHEGITCIVGPNGSGKSNISDAIRWVLGEQSPKALRGGKMEEVIFSGTANRKSRGMAEVTLVIDNSTGILNIDYNEVAITRRMYRSGESEYLINNNQCRLRDIRELIMDTGIGVDGYSLIGQGKIAEIVSSKPESRREIFEEAAGVVMYKNKKHEAEKKLESTNSNLERVDDIINEISSRIDVLEEDSKKAEEYIDLKKQYKKLEINIILRSIDNINKSDKTFQDDLEEFEKELEKLNNDYVNSSRLAEELAEKKNQLDRMGTEARDKILTMVEEINSITSKQEINKERISGIEKEKENNRQDILEIEKKLEKENKNLELLRENLQRLDEAYKQENDKLQEKIAQLNAAVSEQTLLTTAVDEENEKLFDLHKRKTSAQSESKSIESLKSSLYSRKTEIADLSEEVSKNLNDYNSQIEVIERERKFTAEALEETKREYNQKVSDYSRFSENRKDILYKIEQSKIRISTLTSRKKTIEEMENNYDGYNSAVKTLMRAVLPGVLGVAADLMHVPHGYEVAIETAMGASMQNIICEKDEDAKRAVYFLKTNKAGRLTFLPLNSIRGNKFKVPEAVSAAPGFVGLASDLVSFKADYKAVYEYLLGRVIVVDSMDSAIRLSKLVSGVRFVTMEGEVINASGAITGGAYKNKSANILERKSEIKELAEKIEDAEANLKKAENNLKTFESEKEKFESAISGYREEIQSSEIKLSDCGNRIKSLETLLEKANVSANRHDNELIEINSQLSKTDSLISSLNDEVISSGAEIEQITDMLNDNLDKLNNVKKIVQGLNEEITQARIAVTEAFGKSESTHNLKERIENTVEDLVKQKEEKEAAIYALEDEKNYILTEDGKALVDPSEMIRQKIELEAEVSTIAAEKEKLTAKEKLVEDEKARNSQMINALRDRKNTVEIKLAKNETQMDSLKDKLWEEFEISYIQAVDRKLDSFSLTHAQNEVRQIKDRLKELGDVNVGAISEYKSTSDRLKFLTEQRSDITNARDELLAIITEMDGTIKSKFKENFDNVSRYFEEIFRELFNGGLAKLIMEDESNPLESGIDIVAQPPGKKLQNINLMSGGEKTMTAIALMFAVLKTKPTPFCILDEVEAALDDANIDRFANYLRKFDNIQFALVTHQKATMEHADVLYGVTMAEHGVSKVLSLRLGDDFKLD